MMLMKWHCVDGSPTSPGPTVVELSVLASKAEAPSLGLRLLCMKTPVMVRGLTSLAS